MCHIAKNWLHCTPSRARQLLEEDENDDDFTLMLDYMAWETVEKQWAYADRKSKQMFVKVTKKLRDMEGRKLADPFEEQDALMWEAKLLCLKYNGDSTKPPEDDLSAPTPQTTETHSNEKPRARPRFGSK